MKSCYKVGDRVVVTNAIGTFFKKGYITTIVSRSHLLTPEKTEGRRAWILRSEFQGEGISDQHLFETQFKPYIADKLDLI
jgi:hypothetical protein